MEHLKVEKMAMQAVSSEQKMIGYGEVIFFWFLVWLFGIQYHYGKLLPNIRPRVFLVQLINNFGCYVLLFISLARVTLFSNIIIFSLLYITSYLLQ